SFQWSVLVRIRLSGRGRGAQFLIDVGPVLFQKVSGKLPAKVGGIADKRVTDAAAACRIVRVGQGFARQRTHHAGKVGDGLSIVAAGFQDTYGSVFHRLAEGKAFLYVKTWILVYHRGNQKGAEDVVGSGACHVCAETFGISFSALTITFWAVDGLAV